MADLTSIRFINTNSVTVSKMVLPDGEKLFNIELPWRNNRKSISCIPVGTYQCSPGYYYKRGYPCINILNVSGRTEVKFHIGNWPHNSEACILPNMSWGISKGVIRGFRSAVAFKKLMSVFGRERFTFEIKNYNEGILA